MFLCTVVCGHLSFDIFSSKIVLCSSFLIWSVFHHFRLSFDWTFLSVDYGVLPFEYGVLPFGYGFLSLEF